MSHDIQQDEKIILLENNYQHMTKQINSLELAVKEGFAELKEEFRSMREESDKKYASKLVEKIVYGLVGIVLTTFVISINYLVFR